MGLRGSDESSAAVVAVRRGEDTQVDDQSSGAVTAVSGRVTDAEGNPLENICASP